MLFVVSPGPGWPEQSERSGRLAVAIAGRSARPIFLASAGLFARRGWSSCEADVRRSVPASPWLPVLPYFLGAAILASTATPASSLVLPASNRPRRCQASGAPWQQIGLLIWLVCKLLRK
uniref:Uncharacterized protein n=2 Tax=Triticum urartu TaxID=4572 RepID=A0A8R7TTV6_TRIUA